MNLVENLVEALLGYVVDWDATGTWAQLAAALVALCVAGKISRAELVAQRTVAKEAEQQFVTLTIGLARRAAGDICIAAEALRNEAMSDLVQGGDGPQIPSTAANVMSLRELDLNRMRSAEMALAVVELRRLSGWGKTYERQARESWIYNNALDNDLEKALDQWVTLAQDALGNIENEASNKLR